jgi:hypothetical protein
MSVEGSRDPHAFGGQFRSAYSADVGHTFGGLMLLLVHFPSVGTGFPLAALAS